MARYSSGRISQTEQWVLGTGTAITDVEAVTGQRSVEIDSFLSDLTADIMSSPAGLQSSLNQYEQLVKKQLSFNGEDSDDSTPPQTRDGEEEGVFDKPLTEEQQQGMRAVQNTLEKLDSKHGVLQRHASAECVRESADDNDLLKRTMSDSIRRSSSGSDINEPVGEPDSPPPASADDRSQPPRSRSSSAQSDSQQKSGPPSRIPQPEAARPQLKNPLTTKRTVPMTSSSPKTQVQEPCRPLKVKATENAPPYKDIPLDSPDKATSIRQLLVESKAETSYLKRQVGELIAENNRLKGGSGLPNGHKSSTESVSHIHGKLAESERRCDNLLREKENMATELWKLRQQVEDLMNSRSEFGSDLGDAAASNHKARGAGVDRIAELESQVQDLQEANETGSAEVLRLDQENQMLTAHIKKLTSSMDADSEVERELLQQQLSALRKRQDQQGDDELLHLRSELARLRIDLNAMHEKTSILQEENVKLRESLREIKSSERWKGSGSSVNDSPGDRPTDHHDSKHSTEAAWEEINALKQRIREFSTRNPLISPSRPSDKRNPYLPSAAARISSAYDRTNFRSVHSSREPSLLDSAYNSANQKKGSFRPSYQPSIQSSDDRPPSPSGRSDISESTTVLMAGFEAYKPLSRSANLTRLTPRKMEDDRISECTMDILNEATFNTQAFGTYDVNDDVLAEKTDSRKEHVRRGSVGSSSVHSESTQERLAPPSSYGLRSVLLPVLPTQHNKLSGGPAKSALSTAGRRPIAPRSPADLAIGDIAKFTKPDGRICRGTVKFVGHLHDKNETYIGLELEYQDGKHDGIHEGVRYFDCKPNRGAFITFNKVIMAWGS